MIPENKQVVVQKALLTAFDTTHYDAIEQITRGLSTALIFKITVHGKPYLLRAITRTDAMADPTYYFECMKAAADTSLAPRVLYQSAEDRILITDFIVAQRFPPSDARIKMADLLRQVHALPKFALRTDYFKAMGTFVSKAKTAKVFPEHVTKEMFNGLEKILAVYPVAQQADWVSCHNDLKPENIIFDGDRPWLIDWEAAFLNDRYLDLNVVANFVITSDDEETEFLERYFGGPVTEYQRARFFIMGLVLNAYCSSIFILLGAAGNAVDIDSIDKPGFRALNDRMWNGEIDLAYNGAKLQYGWTHLEEFLRKIQTSRFEQAMNLLVAAHRI